MTKVIEKLGLALYYAGMVIGIRLSHKICCTCINCNTFPPPEPVADSQLTRALTSERSLGLVRPKSDQMFGCDIGKGCNKFTVCRFTNLQRKISIILKKFKVQQHIF